MKFKKPKREVNKVYIHCSASDVKLHDNIETIREWHVRDNKWSDVGYHYFITKNGTIEEGRSLETMPSAQKGHNTGSIAICLSGLHPDLFRQEQFESLIELCKEINQSYYKVTFHGHCEVSNKECPVFDYKKILDLDDEGYMPLILVSDQVNKANLLTTKNKKKKMPILTIAAGAISLVKLFAPSIINKFKKAGKDLAENTAKELIKKAEKKLGFKITDEKSAGKARDQLDSKDLFELEKLALRTDAEMFRDELKYGEDLSETWKDDAVTWFVIFYVTMFALVGFYNPGRASEAAKVIAEILETYFGIVFVITAVTAVGGRRLLNKLVDKFFIR